MPTQLGKHFWPNWAFVYGLRLDYLSPTIYLTDIFILGIFLFSLPKLIQEIKQVQKKYFIGSVLILLVFLVGLMGSKNLGAGLYGVIKFLEFSFLVYFAAKNYKSFNQVVLFCCVFLAIVFEASLAILQYLNQGSLGGIFYFFGERAFNATTPGIANASINGQLFLRPYATFSHPNVLAGFLILAMLLLFLFSLKNRLLKPFALIGIILGTSALFLTLSRTAILLWIIYLVILFGLWMFEKYKKHNFNPQLLVFSIVTILVVIVFLVWQNNYVLQRFLTTKLSDESVVQRQELISQSLKMFSTNPLFGTGINNFYNNLSFNISNQKSEFIQPVHNIFLLVLSETGIIGLCAFLFLLLKSFLAILKKQNKYLLLSLLAIIFLGMFDHYFLTLQQGQLLLSLVLGISLAKS